MGYIKRMYGYKRRQTDSHHMTMSDSTCPPTPQSTVSPPHPHPYTRRWACHKRTPKHQKKRVGALTGSCMKRDTSMMLFLTVSVTLEPSTMAPRNSANSAVRRMHVHVLARECFVHGNGVCVCVCVCVESIYLDSELVVVK